MKAFVSIRERLSGIMKLHSSEEKPRELYDPELVAALEIQWRRSLGNFDVNAALITRAALLHRLDESYGLTPENAYDAAFHEWVGRVAITDEEKRVRYLRHFESSKKGTTLGFDAQKAADIVFEMNTRSAYKDNPLSFVNGIADLHQLVYGIGEEKTSEMQEAAESYGHAINSMIKSDYKLAQKHFEDFYSKLHKILLS